MELTIFIAGGSLVVAGSGLALARWDKWQGARRTIEVRVTEVPVLPAEMNGRSEWGSAALWWDKAKIEQPRYIRVEFRNTGRVEVKNSDISQAPRVEIVDGVLIAGRLYRVTGNPAARRLIKNVAKNGNGIDAPELPLNPGDSLEFWLLVDGGTAPPDWDFLAGGFKVVSRDSPGSAGRRPALLRRLIALLIVLGGVLMAASSFFLH